MAWETTITAQGITMLGQLVSGSTLTLTKVQTGIGTVPSADLYTQTSVSTPVTTGAMTRQVESDGAVIKIKIYSYDNAYTMKQIGVFGKVGNGTEALFAILQNTDGIDILEKGTFPDFAFNVSLFVKSDHADSITVVASSSALVTEAQLNEAMANVVNLERSYYSSAAQVSCPCTANSKTYLVWSSDANGNIMSETTGCIAIVSNGSYGVIHKGSSITFTVLNDTFTLSSTTSVPMAVVEL